MKRLIKKLIVFLILFEILLVMGLVSITDEKVKQVHDAVVKKVVDFFEKVWQKFCEFFCRGSKRFGNGEAEVLAMHMNGSDLFFLLTSNASLRFREEVCDA